MEGPVSLPDRARRGIGIQGTAVAAHPAGVDLAVEVDGDEQMLVIIEIKGTGWDLDFRSSRVCR
jgi:hypothetical protein